MPADEGGGRNGHRDRNGGTARDGSCVVEGGSARDGDRTGKEAAPEMVAVSRRETMSRMETALGREAAPGMEGVRNVNPCSPNCRPCLRFLS